MKKTMKLKTVFLIVFALGAFVPLCAENPASLSVGVEFGGNEVSTSLNEKWNIRQDVGSNYYGYNSSSNSIATNMYISHFAVKPEIRLFDDKLAFSSGLRFSNVMSDVSIWGNQMDNAGYFYLRYNNTGLNTEYAKVKMMNESTNYLGIPIDVKLIPFSFWKMDFYIKTGIEFNFKLSSNTQIDFANDAMNKFEQTIIDHVGLKVNNLYSTWSSALGVSLGNKNRLQYNIELLLPSFFITNNNSTLVNTEMFTGFRCSIQFPIRQSIIKQTNTK